MAPVTYTANGKTAKLPYALPVSFKQGGWMAPWMNIMGVVKAEEEGMSPKDLFQAISGNDSSASPSPKPSASAKSLLSPPKPSQTGGPFSAAVNALNIGPDQSMSPGSGPKPKRKFGSAATSDLFGDL